MLGCKRSRSTSRNLENEEVRQILFKCEIEGLGESRRWERWKGGGACVLGEARGMLSKIEDRDDHGGENIALCRL